MRYQIQIKNYMVNVKSFNEASEKVIQAAKNMNEKDWENYPSNGFVYNQEGVFKGMVTMDGKKWKDADGTKPRK